LKLEKQEAVVRALMEGCSVRAVERLTGTHRDTICRLTVRLGAACDRLHDETMRDLPCQRIEMDELWAFVRKKQRQVTAEDDPQQVGDAWCWIALDPDSKVVPAYRVGKRTGFDADSFVADLAGRLRNRVYLSADALGLYVEAVERGFGPNVDFAQVVKAYEAVPIGPGRYSPPRVTSVSKEAVVGSPDLVAATTSHSERLNLSVRTSLRRFTRLSLGFSKTFGGLRGAVSLFMAHYNLVRVHRSLRVTPAMAAGVTRRLWSVRDLVDYAAQTSGNEP